MTIPPDTNSVDTLWLRNHVEFVIAKLREIAECDEASRQERLDAIEGMCHLLDMFTERVVHTYQSVDGLAQIIESATSKNQLEGVLAEIGNLLRLTCSRLEELAGNVTPPDSAS